MAAKADRTHQLLFPFFPSGPYRFPFLPSVPDMQRDRNPSRVLHNGTQTLPVELKSCPMQVSLPSQRPRHWERRKS